MPSRSQQQRSQAPRLLLGPDRVFGSRCPAPSIGVAPGAPGGSLAGANSRSGDRACERVLHGQLATALASHARRSPGRGSCSRFRLGLAIEASYIPPVQVGDAHPHLGSAALSETAPLGGFGPFALIGAHAPRTRDDRPRAAGRSPARRARCSRPIRKRGVTAPGLRTTRSSPTCSGSKACTA